MGYRVVNGKMVYVPDGIKTPEQMAAENKAAIDNLEAVKNQKIEPNVPVTPQETLDAVTKKIAPLPSYDEFHTDMTAPVVKTPEQRVQDISNANDLESALAAAREDADRATWVKKRLANKAYWDSIASTVGALGKFAVVGSSPDGRDVTTGDAAAGSRAAYDEAAKRRDLEVAKLEALQKEGRGYNNALAQLAEKMRIQREQQAEKYREQQMLAEYKARLEAGLIDQRANAGIRRDNNASGNRRAEIDARGEYQMDAIGARNAQRDKDNEFRHNERVDHEQWQADQNQKNRDAKGNSGSSKGGTTRGGTRTGVHDRRRGSKKKEDDMNLS